MNRYSIQNQSCLNDPVTGRSLTGDRIFDGDTVFGEWYDTGNEIAGQKIVDALNNQESIESLKRQRDEAVAACRQIANAYDAPHKFSKIDAVIACRNAVKSVEAK